MKLSQQRPPPQATKSSLMDKKSQERLNGNKHSLANHLKGRQ